MTGNFELTTGYMEIPFPPCISQLKGERHAIKADHTVNIIEYNKVINGHNALNSSTIPPSLATCGIDGASDDVRECRHLPECWHEKGLKNMVHLAAKVKAQKWMEVIQYFKDI